MLMALGFSFGCKLNSTVLWRGSGREKNVKIALCRCFDRHDKRILLNIYCMGTGPHDCSIIICDVKKTQINQLLHYATSFIFMPTFEKGGAYYFAHVGRYVGIP